MPASLQKRFLKLFLPDRILAQIPAEEKRKRVYVIWVTILAIPFFTGFGLVNLAAGNRIESAAPDLLASALFIATLLFLRTSVDGRVAYRTLMAGFAFILFYNVAIGLYQGSDVLWLYVYPLVAFFMFGIVEGFVWNIALLGLTFIIILFPDLLNSHPFSPAYKVRLILSLAVVTLVACLLESLRAHFFEQLRRRKIELENALRDIKTLQGLVPICASCKKIKDDQGYWQAVDDYLASHADVKVSHGLCEECLKENEPEIYRSLVARGKIKPPPG